MRNIYVKYDPYEMITEFKVNNIPVTEMDYRHPWLDKVLGANSMIPLQSWIDPVSSEKWDGLLAYLEKMSDDTFSISFCGRKTDFEDLKESLSSQNKKQGNVLKLEFPKGKQQFIMSDSEMKVAIDEVVSIMSEDRFKAMVRKSENEKLKSRYDSMQTNISAITNKEFRIVFTGVYSGGKSTVINALVGKNILPQAGGTCTDKICYIRHSKEVAYSKVVYVKNDGQTEEKLCDSGEATQEMIRNASNIDGVEKVDIYVDISHLYPDNLQDQFRLVFVDTPGFGSAKGDDVSVRGEDVTHSKLTKGILSSDEKEMVVLVSDTKSESLEIPEILDIFENQAGEDHGCYNDRFLFVLNRCDEFKFHAKQKDIMTERYEGLENEVLKLKETVSKMSHGTQQRNIANPRVFPLSAATALAIKIGCNDAQNKPERETELRDYYNAYDEFCEKLTDYRAEYFVNGSIDVSKVSDNYLLDSLSDLTDSQKRELQEKYDHAENIEDYLLLHSGILSLETAIKSYIEKYAFPIKMRKLLRAFKSILQEVNEENRSYLTDLKAAGDKLKQTQEEISSEKKTTDRDAVRKRKLEDAESEMESILRNVGDIEVDLPEMDEVYTEYLRMQNDADKYFDFEEDSAGKKRAVRDITNDKAEEIRKKISDEVNNLADLAKDKVSKVKTARWKAASECAQEFNRYLGQLENEKLLSVGSFNIQNTVAYQDIVGDGSFMKYDCYARDIDNPDKGHIEIGDGILNFLVSIRHTIATAFEPSRINRVDAFRYKEKIFASLESNVNNLISSVKTSYKSDIEYMKKEMTNKMQAVLDLIAKINKEIMRRNEKITKDLETKEGYRQKKKMLEDDCEFLLKLINKLNVIEQGGN